MTKKTNNQKMKEVKVMDHVAFLYWLQGFFEIAKPKKLTKDQIEEVKSHMNIVGQKNEFVHWLEGFLSAWDLSDKTASQEKEFCNIIKEKLASCFENITRQNKVDQLEQLLTKSPRLPEPHGPCFPHSPMLPREPLSDKLYC